jgi:hypothetical protein
MLRGGFVLYMSEATNIVNSNSATSMTEKYWKMPTRSNARANFLVPTQEANLETIVDHRTPQPLLLSYLFFTKEHVLQKLFF